MQILDEFLAYEQRISADAKPRTSRFIKHKSWYVNENYMKKIFVYPMLPTKNKIHSLCTKPASGLIKNFVIKRKAHELFPSTADAFHIKDTGERLRAFYSTKHTYPYTLKIVCDSDSGSFTEELKREVAVREKLVALKTINIPKVLATEHRKDVFVLSEEMILGRRFNARTDRMLYRKSLLPQLRDTYQAYGVRYTPIQTFLPPDLSQKVIGLVRARAAGERFATALQNVVSENGLVAVSLCHGGLSSGNLAVENGEVFFLDWRRAFEGLIIVDLLRMATKNKKHSYIVKYIREIMTSNFIVDSCRFEELLTAGIALEILRLPSRIAKILRIWQHHVS